MKTHTHIQQDGSKATREQAVSSARSRRPRGGRQKAETRFPQPFQTSAAEPILVARQNYRHQARGSITQCNCYLRCRIQPFKVVQQTNHKTAQYRLKAPLPQSHRQDVFAMDASRYDTSQGSSSTHTTITGSVDLRLEALAPVLYIFVVRLVHLGEVHPPAEDAADTAEPLAELAPLLRSVHGKQKKRGRGKEILSQWA